MTPQTQLDPSPFFLDGGPTGVLLTHGFTGSPPEMRLVGNYLHERGFTVSAPLLPGHGTTIEDLNRRKWREWASHVEAAYTDLKARCDTVFAAGLSMGSLLSVNLVADHPEIPGVVLYAPAVRIDNNLLYLTPVMKYLLPVWEESGESDMGNPQANALCWGYAAYPVRAAHELLKLNRRVRRLLPGVRCPALIFHAARDRHIGEDGSRYVLDRIGSQDKELVVLANSGHALTVDQEWETAAKRTAEFLEPLR